MTAIADPTRSRARRNWRSGAGAKARPPRRCWTRAPRRLLRLRAALRARRAGADLIERAMPFFVEKPLAADEATAEAIAAAVAAARPGDGGGLSLALSRHHGGGTRAASRARRPGWRSATGSIPRRRPPGGAERGAVRRADGRADHAHLRPRPPAGGPGRRGVSRWAAHRTRPAYPDCDVDDASTATLRFASGAVGSMASTCLLHWPHRIGLNLFGDGLAIELTEFELMVDVGRGRPVHPRGGRPLRA